ncbi:Pirin domain protein [Alkaliphilus metalliredigens QYMF]|uniref:Pirin domain protein n=1 Tax=Alkaliphilus metalliredigens (strain QYMF) TaxID=293826 RepID=A6TN81_ALKMQ|nr:pirin family protein [Alkaliphilus metalliredigens]ABR47649.1 Pirin domain protein [Alkaliphilus metalliredigens QYMF]
MSKKIIDIKPFEFRDDVGDPFLARMHHVDYYPKSNGHMEVPEAQLVGKHSGEDFDFSSDFKMYYGKGVPGFPSHPHRGFETVTVVLQGYVDHSDSDGASGRYGAGDVQWMTAGSGMQHAEMFPLIHDDQENTMELFQIWLNLPSKDKFVKPSYKMLWAEDMKVIEEKDEAGNTATINLIAGSYKGIKSLDPNPDSWANNRDNHVGIWTIQMEPGSSFTLPNISSTLNRNLYFYQGDSITLDDVPIKEHSIIKLVGDEEIKVTNGNHKSYLLLLEGEPINEPVVNYGPFVMNTKEEIDQAYKDYHATGFGGWPWDQRDPVSPKDVGRFARYDEHRIEIPK